MILCNNEGYVHYIGLFLIPPEQLLYEVFVKNNGRKLNKKLQ